MKDIYFYKKIFVHLFLVRLSAGLPHISNLLIKSLSSRFLAALSSDKNSAQDLKSRKIAPFEVFLKAMAV